MLCFSLSCLPVKAHPFPQPIGLLCKHLTQLIGVDAENPRLSWRLANARAGARQAAGRILVVSDTVNAGTHIVWQSKMLKGASARVVRIPAGAYQFNIN
jgi:alpha-L-rhamnosidase